MSNAKQPKPELFEDRVKEVEKIFERLGKEHFGLSADLAPVRAFIRLLLNEVKRLDRELYELRQLDLFKQESEPTTAGTAVKLKDIK